MASRSQNGNKGHRRHGKLAARAPNPSIEVADLEPIITPAAWASKRQRESEDLHLPPVSTRPLVQSQESIVYEVFHRQKITIPSTGQCRPFMEVRGLGGQKTRVTQPRTIPPGWRGSGGSLGNGYCRKDRARTRSYEHRRGQQEVRTQNLNTRMLRLTLLIA